MAIQAYLRTSSEPNPIGLLPILHQIIIDDDANIRNAGAHLVNLWSSREQATSNVNLALSAPAAKAFILRETSKHPALGKEVVWRMIGMHLYMSDLGTLLVKDHGDILPLRPVSQLLHICKQEQGVTFEEERQNLFMDPVCESNELLQVAVQMNEHAFAHLQEPLVHWVVEGLDGLIEQSRTHDGPLGWATNAQVFTLFTQVLSASRLVLRISQLKQHSESVRDRLDALRNTGSETGLHPYLMREIDSICLI